MKTKNTIEEQLDAIRIDFYEKTKNMSNAEIIAFLEKETAPVHAEFGITPISKIGEYPSRTNFIKNN